MRSTSGHHSEKKTMANDSDTAPALQLKRVGLGDALSDAAATADHVRTEEDLLGQGCLAGVIMRQSPEFERSLHATGAPR
jgi:hypothetical protein